jgi:vacuolar-type H+-ATPase subunit E/Vma4
MFIIDGANDAIADICTAAKEKCEVKPAELRKIAKAYHNNNVDEERDKINDIYDMAEKILKKT